jgi:hypothetical protein
MSCQQEWYAYYDGQQHDAWAKADFGANVPEVLDLKDIKNEIGSKIEAEGGQPDVLIDAGVDPSDTPQTPEIPATTNSAPPTASVTAIADAIIGAVPIPVASIVVDAITGVGPIVPENTIAPESAVPSPPVDILTRFTNQIAGLPPAGPVTAGPYAMPQDQLPSGTSICPKKSTPAGRVPTCQK